MKGILIFSLLLFTTFTYGQNCILTNNLIINSGYDPITNAPISIGSNDPKWVIDNANNIPGAINNSPAIACNFTGLNATNPNSTWIGFANPSQYITNNPTVGFYLITFRYTFKTCFPDNLNFDINISNDNYCSAIRVDGVATGFSQPVSLIASNWQTWTNTTYTNLLPAGTHTIEIDVQNFDVTNALNPHLLNVFGSITGSTNSIVSATSPINCNCVSDTVIANFNHSYPQICDSTIIQFNDLSSAINSTITNWDWDFDDGNTSTLQNPIHNYATVGNYLVRLIVTNNFSHKDTFTLNVITINNTPNVTAIANPAQVCAGQSSTLTASGAQSYVWTGGIQNGVPFVPSSTNSYIVIGTDVKGCTNSAVVSVTVIPPIQISINPSNPLLCLSDSIQLTASGASTYTWLPNYALNTVTGNNVWARPTTSTIYTVTGTDNGCIGTKIVLVDVITDPKLILNKSNDVNCDNKTIQLSVSGASDYSWSPANLCSNPLSNATNATINKTTTFTVIGKVGSCQSIDSITVNHYNNSASGIFIPNAFSPNGDGKNDCWGVQAFGNYKSYFLTIFNRWGMPIFESTNPDDCWNGYYRREKQNIDTYFYYLEAETECGNIFRKGDILLIR